LDVLGFRLDFSGSSAGVSGEFAEFTGGSEPSPLGDSNGGGSLVETGVEEERRFGYTAGLASGDFPDGRDAEGNGDREEKETLGPLNSDLER
jgi:hypothetical protein